MSSKQTPTKPNHNRAASTQRLPAPSLFVGPPSRNASATSLLPQPASDKTSPSRTSPSQKPALQRQPSRQRPQPSTSRPQHHAPPSPPQHAPGPFAYRQQAQQNLVEQHSNARTDALWAEMQNTLEEVEVSALSGAHVFGTGHAQALEQLRRRQIELARAWGRSEADVERGENNQKEDGKGNGGLLGAVDVGVGRRRSATERSEEEGRRLLEEETERDIKRARERREANDRYFARVSEGVRDVVGMLEEVAKAMKGVEMETREIWGEGDSVEAESMTTASVTSVVGR